MNCFFYEIIIFKSYLPSTKAVQAVTKADFLRPDGKLNPIRFKDSRNAFPPSLDLALKKLVDYYLKIYYFLKIPPNKEAFKHSGGLIRL